MRLPPPHLHRWDQRSLATSNGLTFAHGYDLYVWREKMWQMVAAGKARVAAVERDLA